MPVAIEYRLRAPCDGCSVVALLELCLSDSDLLKDWSAQRIPVLVLDDRLICSLDTQCPRIDTARLEAFKVVYADQCAACGCGFTSAISRTLCWNETQFDWLCETCVDTPQGLLATARRTGAQRLDCSWCGDAATALLFNYHQEQLALCNACLRSQCGQKMLEHHWNVVASMNAAVRQLPPSPAKAGPQWGSAPDGC